MDWRIGAAYFESQLIDYDVHSNYGNWMYVSGVGNDQEIENLIFLGNQKSMILKKSFKNYG